MFIKKVSEKSESSDEEKISKEAHELASRLAEILIAQLEEEQKNE